MENIFEYQLKYLSVGLNHCINHFYNMGSCFTYAIFDLIFFIW